ncbi:SDR family oxidoreductase [Streptomyces chengbuensis]|uniref:SDR family oxidoreductase n=1 Tax=Streptomyces TaxID=1883 RepID=UPI0025B59C27|nr:SDR family oxidoreductase [Streptomyces sp. HUAS CB01]WJY54020.1 SDR family oxidoreductase [Streptomyces sp. HUAS CB01]
MLAYERERIPVGRLGDPEDVADWTVRTADPRGTHVTGQVLTNDGGLELVRPWRRSRRSGAARPRVRGRAAVSQRFVDASCWSV